MLTSRKITDKVFSVESGNWVQVQLAFCRLQEFYEGESTQKASIESIEVLMEQYAEDLDEAMNEASCLDDLTNMQQDAWNMNELRKHIRGYSNNE